MLNRIFKISTLFAFALVFVMTSCQKENLDELTTENFTQQAESREGGQKGMKGKGKRSGKCFTPVFPITINFPDGSSAEVADTEAAKAAKDAFKAANPDTEDRPTINIPFDVQLKDSFILTISSDEDLAALKETCGERGGKGNKGGRGGKCFKPVFPFTINFPDGSAVEVADKEAAKAAKSAYKEANPDSEERPTIAMPFDVQLRDSSTLTITSEEDLAALKETCGERGGKGNKGGRGQRCFKTVFPLTINFPDGSAVEVADREAAKAAKEAFKTANPDSEERPSIAFPYDVELADGTTVTVESDEEVAALKESCEGERDERGDRGNREQGGRPGGN